VRKPGPPPARASREEKKGRVMSMENLIIGQRYEITKRSRQGVEVFTATITNVEDRGEYQYFGFIPDNAKYGQFGYARFYEQPQEWGVQSIKKKM
jgi:hypothetical protein